MIDMDTRFEGQDATQGQGQIWTTNWYLLSIACLLQGIQAGQAAERAQPNSGRGGAGPHGSHPEAEAQAHWRP